MALYIASVDYILGCFLFLFHGDLCNSRDSIANGLNSLSSTNAQDNVDGDYLFMQ